MADENTQPTPEPVPQTLTEPQMTQQPEPAPTQPENPVSEPEQAPVSPQEPTKQTPVQQAESAPDEVPPEPTEAAPSPEDAPPVKDANSANEPLQKDSAPEIPSEPNQPNITIEKHGTDTTITEVMQPKTEPQNETAQMAGNDPLADWQAEKRTENLKLANETRLEKKREKIEKILNLFAERQTVTNDEVEKLLHVSDATATRYLEQLENENKIRQVGKTGKGVRYERI